MAGALRPRWRDERLKMAIQRAKSMAAREARAQPPASSEDAQTSA